MSPKFIWQENTKGCSNVPWMNGVLVPDDKGISRKSVFIEFMKEQSSFMFGLPVTQVLCSLMIIVSLVFLLRK